MFRFNSLRYKISIPTLILAVVTMVIFGIFSYFYLNNLQIKLLNKELKSLSYLFTSYIYKSGEKVNGIENPDTIRNFHNPSDVINEFMDQLSKKSSYPIQLKIASQNPSNLLFISNEKDDELIEKLKREGGEEFSIVEPDVNGIPVYYYVKAVKAKSSCLSCHGENPKQFMVSVYDSRGTGYKEGDIMAAAIFSTPIQYIKEENTKSIVYFIAILSVLFIIMTVVLNILIYKLVIVPIQKLTKAAEDISMGDISKEIKTSSNDEIGKLEASFERMRISIAKMIELLDKQ